MARRCDSETGVYREGYARKRAEQQTHDERLLRAIAAVLPPRATTIDIGAGSGWIAAELRKLGTPAEAYDGCALPEAGVRAWDLTQLHPEPGRHWQWGLFIEVAEHIRDEHQDAVVRNITAAVTEGMVVSYALPGQRGLNHVSCKTPMQVQTLFEKHGWKTNIPMSNMARSLARGNKASRHGFDRKLIVFTREGANVWGIQKHAGPGSVPPISQRDDNHPGQWCGNLRTD